MLRYAGDFIPSWAGAISIDLMPAVLVLILCVVHGAIRREEAAPATAASMTAAELMTALRLARELEQAQHAPRADVGENAKPAAQEPLSTQHEPDENIRPLVTARAGKRD